MATLNFFLKEPNADKDTIIYLVYRNRQRRINFKISIGEKVPPEEWDKANQRMRKRAGLPYKNFNRMLDLLQRNVEDIIFKLRSSDKLDEENLKEKIGGLLRKQSKISLYDYLDQIVSEGEYEKVKAFGTLKSKFQQFSEERRRKVDFELITPTMVEEFIEWLQSKNYSANYVGQMVKLFRRAMNRARKAGIHENPVKISDAFIAEDVYNVYLTNEESQKLMGTALPPYLERARDLFIVGCYTGMRVGNYLNIDPETHIDLECGFIYAIVNKNGPRVKIPIHPEVKKIIQKYNGLPHSISEQKLNKYLKEVCKRAGLIQPVIWVRTEGGKRVEHVSEKWEMVTSHTARRSFATNAYKAGIAPFEIMQITGHKSQKTFFKYIKITQEEAAERMAEHPFFK